MSSEVIAIGHRGAPRRARENTLSSLDIALDLGADWVEVDAKVTKDGEVIVIHDDTLHRLWNLALVVRESLWDDIHAKTSVESPGIPTLTQAIELLTTRRAVLLIDIADEIIAEACCALPAVRANPESVAFTGDPGALALVRDALPRARISLSWEETALPSEDLFARVRPDYFNQMADLIDDDLVTHLHRQGMAVSAYTVDEAEEMTRLLDCGVDAVISNDIALLRAVVDARREGAR